MAYKDKDSDPDYVGGGMIPNKRFTDNLGVF
jgi:hypothetical protein